MNLYTLEISIISGPVTQGFINDNPVVSRTIEIRGNQTLEDLHHVIFEAFDREEEHMYEFQVGGKGPNNPRARCYGLTRFMADKTGLKGDVARTTLDSLKLKIDEAFGYWFDFGDDWWHQINILSIEQATAGVKYPRVINRIGQSPPQYPDTDD